jgi:hypothetical protein
MHSCGQTCTKYSFQDGGKGKQRHPCRFRAPWRLRAKTEFTLDRLLHIRRDHERINRYCPALAVALRHNTDAAFLATNTNGLAMVYYATNYSTKLDSPLWKRAALVRAVFEGLAERDDEGVDADKPVQEKIAQRNSRGRQLLARTANQIFTSRELSAVEVCSNLLGYENSYSSEARWARLHLNTLYWAVFRRWSGLQEAAGPEAKLRAAPETIGIGETGATLSALEAYAHRGPLLKEICFYEYLGMVHIRRVSPRSKLEESRHFPFDTTLACHEYWTQELRKNKEDAVPVITGQLDHDVNSTLEGFYKRYVLETRCLTP